jgi:2-polyprenyl-6-methoxyphenol hydroxylase-like FAD-dependent oxidoreductase
MTGQRGWERDDADVIVVGGGPVGLLLAAELALGGARATVLEERAEVDPTIKAGALNVPSAEILDRRGLWPEAERIGRENRARFDAFLRTILEERGVSLEEYRKRGTRGPAGHFGGIMLDAGRINRDDPELAGRGSDRSVVAIPQEDVERMLERHAVEQGAEVRRGVRVESFEQDTDGVTVGCADGTELRARWLVGCDGGRSAVRKRAGFAFPGTDPEITAYQALAEMTGTEGLEAGWHATETGVYVFGPVPGRILIAQFTGTPVDRQAPITEAELEASIRHVTGVQVNVHAIRSATRFTDNARQVPNYRIGHVLLAGDAAHVHSPFGGQGLNLGLGDAMNLGWKLAAVCRGEQAEELLETYTTERHPIGAWVLEWTRAQISIMRPEPQARAMRAVVEALAETVDGTTYFVKRISGVWQRYDLGGSHPLIGGSAPETEFADGSRLADHLHPGRALLIDPSKSYASTAAGYEDRLTILTAPLANTGQSGSSSPEPAAAFFVRPDGFVAWATGAQGADAVDEDDEGLVRALRTWLGAPRHSAVTSGVTGPDLG